LASAAAATAARAHRAAAARPRGAVAGVRTERLRRWLFSRSALAKAWGRHGFRTGSFDDNMHVAFRTLPDFARHLVK
jgi:hypothetical protein